MSYIEPLMTTLNGIYSYFQTLPFGVPKLEELYTWVDKQTSIGQCVANATRAVDVLRCDPDLSTLPTKYGPTSLCYKPISGMGVYDLSCSRITRQLFSADLIEKVTQQAKAIEKLCYAQRRICAELFDGTKETALQSYECLKPYFGNMFHFENDTSLQNLCRIAYNKFSEARGLLEINLFARGASFFDKNCSQIEPLFLFPSSLPFENYLSEEDFYISNALAIAIGYFAFSTLNTKLEKSSRARRVFVLLSSGTLLANWIYFGNWRQNNFYYDYGLVVASTSFIASSALGAIYHVFRKDPPPFPWKGDTQRKIESYFNAKTKKGDPSLHLAITNRKLSSLQTLIKCGANLEEKNDCSDTPLHHAIDDEDFPYPEAVQCLVRSGASIFARNIYGETAIGVIWRTRNFSLLKPLMTGLILRLTWIKSLGRSPRTI